MSNGTKSTPPGRASIVLSKIPSNIKKLRRRLEAIEQIPSLSSTTDLYGLIDRVVADANSTIDEVFGHKTVDARDFYSDASWFSGWSDEWDQIFSRFNTGLNRTKECLKAAIRRLEERQEDADEDSSDRTLRAYEGLGLHPEIARAASELYLNGHYANAIEDAVKALNALVRLRGGEDSDGTALMQTTFSPKNPILQFNELSDANDLNEQTGFMMMFSGAVAGLRNPRAHSLIKDNPERALEFIAFVSLLAKLLDGAKKVAIPK